MTKRSVYHIEVMEGTDYEGDFVYVDPVTSLPIDVTGYSATLTARENMNDTYDGQYNDVFVLQLTSAPGGGLTVGTTDGKITVTVTAAQTTGLLWNRAVYDMILTSPAGKRIPFIGGFFVIISSAD